MREVEIDVGVNIEAEQEIQLRIEIESQFSLMMRFGLYGDQNVCGFVEGGIGFDGLTMAMHEPIKDKINGK